MRIPLDDAYRLLTTLEVEEREETPVVAKVVRIHSPEGREAFLVVKRADEAPENEDAFL